MKRYQLTVTLLDDLHTGSGTGAGDYDALLARDSNGKPMIPASHWLGVWKYNLERSKLCSEKTIAQLFGAANEQRKAVIATGLYWRKGGKSLPWTSTTRKAFSRVAEDNTLRTKEFIPAGSVFEATLWLRDARLYDALNTARRLTDCLGARRQRGDGRIKTCLTPIEPSRAVSVNKAHKSSVRLVLRALDPLCLPITGSPDNLIRSACYVRGQTLRGTLTEWLLENKSAAAQYFLSGDVQVGNAYAVPASQAKAWKNWQVLPMPLHFATPKPKGAKANALPWWASDSAASEWHNQFAKKDNEPHGEKLKRPSDNSFIFSPDGQSWQSFNVTLSERLRNSPPTQKNPDGSLFAQEEIPEKTLFLAELVFPSSEIANAVLQSLQSLLQKEGDCLTIGRGGAPLIIEDWQDYQPIINGDAKKPNEELLITLTSDLIARSPYLGFYDKLTPNVLIELINLKTTESLDLTGFDYCEKGDYKGDYVEVYGFNVATGLPRLPALAIRRGSSLQIKGEGVDALRAALIDNSPLGERTEEGFGRFRLDFVIEPDHFRTGSPSKDCQSCSNPNSEEKMYALAEDAFAHIKGKNDFPPLSQWQALRFPEVFGKTLADLIDEHRQRLENKDDTSKVKWLKNCSEAETWLNWLINQLQAITEDKQQRVFYRALLSKVRLELRDESGAIND